MINIISGQSDLTISWDQNDKSLLRGGLNFEDPGENIEGGIEIFTKRQGEPAPLHTMIALY